MLKKVEKGMNELTMVVLTVTVVIGICALLVSYNVGWFVPNGTYSLSELYTAFNTYNKIKWLLLESTRNSSLLLLCVTVIELIVKVVVTKKEAQA